MLNNQCPQDFAEVFMGHTSKLGSSNGTYYTAIVPKLKEAYLEFMPHLSLLTPVETKVIESQSYKELKSQNEALKERIAALETREEAREPYDDKMTELMKRLIANPEMKELIKKELGEIKGEKA